jgi:hypothetical protein
MKNKVLPIESNLLTTKQASEYMGKIFSVSKLEHFRCDEDPEGPPFVKIGKGVRYRKEDLDRYIESNVVNPEIYRKHGR